MGDLFNYDSKFFEILEIITNIVILNFLFVFSSIPIITIGASLTSTYSISLDIIAGKEGYIIKDFIKEFRNNFKKSTIIWSMLLFTGIILVFDFRISDAILNESFKMLLKLIFTIVSIIYTFIITYVFAITAKFENTIKNTVINSIFISIKYLPYTIIAIIVNLSPIFLMYFASYYWGQIIFFYTIIGFGIIAYINSSIFNKIFDNLIKEMEIKNSKI